MVKGNTVDTRRITVHPEKCALCYRCQLACTFLKKQVFSSDDAFIQIKWDPSRDKADIGFTDECDRCGVCARACLYEALEFSKGKQ